MLTFPIAAPRLLIDRLTPADASWLVGAILDAVLAPQGDLVRVVAYVDTRNAPSLALFDRLGFTNEERLRGSFQEPGGARADEVRFAVAAAEWRRRRPGTHTVPGEGAPRPDGTDVGREEEPG